MTATKKKPDLEVVMPAAGAVEVAGIPCTVRRLKTREFLALLKVLTTGMGPALGQVKLSGDDPEELQGQLLGLFLVAAPNAIDEFAEFLFSIVEPVKSSDRAQLTKEMVNPEPEVLLDVLTVVAVQERDDLTVLAGKARAAISQIQTAYRPAG